MRLKIFTRTVVYDLCVVVNSLHTGVELWLCWATAAFSFVVLCCGIGDYVLYLHFTPQILLDRHHERL